MILVSGKLRFSKNFNFWVKKRKKCSNVCVLTLNVLGISRIQKLGSNWRFEGCANLQFLSSRRNQAKKKEYTNKQTNKPCSGKDIVKLLLKDRRFS
jgi:hypothetical protein